MTQRQLKFRAWDRQGKYFLDVEAHFSDEVSITPDDWSRGNFSPARFEADQSTIELMQYTGLKDKNGKDLYEGDVVKVDGKRAEVIFREGEFKFKPEFNVDEEGEHYYTIQWTPVEIIGNVYEN